MTNVIQFIPRSFCEREEKMNALAVAVVWAPVSVLMWAVIAYVVWG